MDSYFPQSKKGSKVKLNFSATIHHGIPIEKFPYNKKPENYLVWLGRITKKKGLTEAIKVAKATKTKLIIAGIINPRDQEIFNKEIKPEIDHKQIFYIGPVGHQSKVKLLKNAKALLYPVSWEEPFGLVMIEALACGTPVIAFKRGSVPEIVKDNKTGYQVRTVSEMIKAVKKLYSMPVEEYQKMRYNCRKQVEKNFTVEKMVDQYEKMYYKILNLK